jgi:hypothetical protein
MLLVRLLRQQVPGARAAAPLLLRHQGRAAAPLLLQHQGRAAAPLNRLKEVVDPAKEGVDRGPEGWIVPSIAGFLEVFRTAAMAMVHGC